MKESEKMANVMDKGHKSGLMEVSISENGKIKFSNIYRREDKA